MPRCCDKPNFESISLVETNANDPTPSPHETAQVDQDNQPDWHLKEWVTHFGKRQAALVNELGWDKARASYLWHGKQPYRRDIVNEVASWLGIEPFELLMPPSDALALRSLREAAKAIVANQPPPAAPLTSKPSRGERQ